MHDTIAVIHVDTLTESAMNDNRELTRLFKVETPAGPDADANHDEAALWVYNNSGYGYLESLGTADPDDAIAEAKERVRDYALNEEITDLTVTSRD